MNRGKAWRIGGWVLTVWVSMALMAYGVALQKYGQEQREVSRSGPGPVEIHSGRVANFKISWPRSRGARLEIEGDSRTYLLPGEFVPNEGRWTELDKLVQTGANVWFKSTASTGTILELQLNPGTPFLKILVNWDTSMGMVSHMGEGYSETGTFFFALGFLTIPLAGLYRRFGGRLIARFRRARSAG